MRYRVCIRTVVRGRLILTMDGFQCDTLKIATNLSWGKARSKAMRQVKRQWRDEYNRACWVVILDEHYHEVWKGLCPQVIKIIGGFPR